MEVLASDTKISEKDKKKIRFQNANGLTALAQRIYARVLSNRGG